VHSACQRGNVFPENGRFPCRVDTQNAQNAISLSTWPAFPLIAGFDPRSPAAEAKNLIINHFYFADFKILFTFAKE